jgi:tetratricopeptide (TPR) repeat protein
MAEHKGRNVVDFNTCVNPAIGQSIALYEASILDEPQRAAFEQHVLDCPRCAQDLYDMSAVTELLRSEGKALFGEKETSAAKQPTLVSFPFLQTQAWKIAACVIAVIAIGSLLLWQPWKAPNTEMALFALPLQPPMIQVQIDPARARHFQAGLEFYQQKKFLEAIHEFDLASQVEGEYQQASFFIGMSYLYEGDARKAIENLQKALQSSNDYESMVRWYLATAEWQLNQREHAIQELQRIEKLNKDFTAKAQEALRKLGQRQR